MQRIATLTALAAIACAAGVAFAGVFEPMQEVLMGSEGVDAVQEGARSLGRNSAGVLLGAFIGGGVALLSHTLVATALKFSTEAAFKALTLGFFAKSLGAILPWAALTYLPQVARMADPTAYLIGFAVTVVLVLGGGLFDHLRAINDGSILNDVSGSPDKDYENESSGPFSGSKGSSRSDSHKGPAEIESDVSDSRSGSASSSPRKPFEGHERTRSVSTAPSSDSPVSPPEHPLGSSDSLESAT